MNQHRILLLLDILKTANYDENVISPKLILYRIPPISEKERKMKKVQKIFSLTYMLLCPVLGFLLMEFYSHNPFKTMEPLPIMLNLVLFELIALFLLALISSVRASLIILILFCAVYGLANYFVLEFRGAPIQPWDIFSVTTAASVADNYEYKLDQTAILVLLGFAVLLVLSLFTRGRIRGIRIRLAVLLLSGLAIFGYTQMLHNEKIVETKLRLYNKLFTPTTIQYKNGTLTAFLMELQYTSVEKPDGYSPDKAKTLLKSFKDLSPENSADQTASGAVVSAKCPNIIVIMNEAFSDPAVLGDFATNQDYMPFVHSMLDGADNTISGFLNVSVKGGNTANTEFEYLTGATMAFLPFGSVPYQQYIHNEMPSMASHLKDLGYRTVAMHPYGASGWERNTVYPDLGFEESYFINFYTDAPRVRKYVSDEGDYTKLIQIFEEKEPAEPLFIFNITMQNHSSYSDWQDYDNFTPDIEVKDSSSKLLPAYLSLIHLSDQAIERLVNYFSQQDQETILVFFGDHQPTDSIVNPVLKLHGKSCSTLSAKEETDRYKVPFFIWANYDISEETNVETSANYLGVKTLQAAGLPLSDFFAFLSKQQADAPLISSVSMKLSDGTLTYADEQTDLLNTYQTLQYYLLFDLENEE